MGTPIALQDIPGILWQAGFRGQGLIDAMAVAIAEAGYTGKDNSTGNTPAGSVDRGLFQINSYWHSEVSDACAADPLCNAEQAFRISSGGTNFNQWSTWLLPNGQPGPAQIQINQAISILGSSVATIAGNIAGFAGASGAYANPGAASNPATVVTAAPVAAPVIAQAVTNAATNVTDPIVGAINNLANQIGTGVNNLGSGVSQFQAFIAWLDQPNLGTRIALAVVGFFVLLLGLILFGVSFLPKGTKLPLPVPV